MDDEDDDEKRVVVVVRVRPKRQFADERYDATCIHVAAAEEAEQQLQRSCTSASVVTSEGDGSNATPPPQTITIAAPDGGEASTFTFDRVFDESDDQDAVYSDAVARPLRAALEGGDLTIMAYGQTGSGKTYTMLGEPYEGAPLDGAGPSSGLQLAVHSGVYLRMMSSLLQLKQSLLKRAHVVLLLSVLEVYNDQLLDLLNRKHPVQLREAGDDLVPMNNTYFTIADHADVRRHFENAYANRAVAATKMNDDSSRSHALFLVEVFQQPLSAANPEPPTPALLLRHAQQATLSAHAPRAPSVPQPGMSARILSGRGSTGSGGPSTSAARDAHAPHVVVTAASGAGRLSAPAALGGGGGAAPRGEATSASDDFGAHPYLRSRITLIDLAGSERLKRSGAAGAQLHEALFVNRSLSALGNVVHHLCVASKHVPFRDTKLTRMLRPNFVAPRAKIVFVATCSPTVASFHETLGTLRFAQRLKEIKPVAGAAPPVTAINAQMEAVLCRQREVEELAAELRLAASAVGYSRLLRAAAAVGGRAWSPLVPRADVRAVLPAYRRRVDAQHRERDEAVQREVARERARLLAEMNDAWKRRDEAAIREAAMREEQRREEATLAALRSEIGALSDDLLRIARESGVATGAEHAVLEAKRRKLAATVQENASLEQNLAEMGATRTVDLAQLEREVARDTEELMRGRARIADAEAFTTAMFDWYSWKLDYLAHRAQTLSLVRESAALRERLGAWERSTGDDTVAAGEAGEAESDLLPRRAASTGPPVLGKTLDVSRAIAICERRGAAAASPLPPLGNPPHPHHRSSSTASLTPHAADPAAADGRLPGGEAAATTALWEFLERRLQSASVVRVASPLAFYFSPSTTKQAMYYSWGPSPPPSPAESEQESLAASGGDDGEIPAFELASESGSPAPAHPTSADAASPPQHQRAKRQSGGADATPVFTLERSPTPVEEKEATPAAAVGNACAPHAAAAPANSIVHAMRAAALVRLPVVERKPDALRSAVLQAHSAVLTALAEIHGTRQLTATRARALFRALDAVAVDERIVEKIVRCARRCTGLHEDHCGRGEDDEEADGGDAADQLSAEAEAGVARANNGSFRDGAVPRVRSAEEALPRRVTSRALHFARVLHVLVESQKLHEAAPARCLVRCLQSHSLLSAYDALAVEDATRSAAAAVSAAVGAPQKRKIPSPRDLSLLRALCLRLIDACPALLAAIQGPLPEACAEEVPSNPATATGGTHSDTATAAVPFNASRAGLLPRFVETLMLCCGYG